MLSIFQAGAKNKIGFVLRVFVLVWCKKVRSVSSRSKVLSLESKSGVTLAAGWPRPRLT